MLRLRSTSPVHFASGPAELLRWMAYWVASRAVNLGRLLREHWHGRLRPALAARREALTARARAALGSSSRTPTSLEPYPSLAVAVRERVAQRGSRYRGNASGISATT